MEKDLKNKFVEHIKSQNNGCLILNPIIDKVNFRGFQNIEITLPLVKKFTKSKLKIINRTDRSAFRLDTNPETIDQDIFVLIDLNTETYSLVFVINDLLKKDAIYFNHLQLIAEQAKISIDVETITEKTVPEIIDIQSFIFNRKVTLYTPKINISPQDLNDFILKFKGVGAKIDFITEDDVDSIKKYTDSEESHKILECIQELKKFLSSNPDEYEEVFHQKINSNRQILDFYGKDIQSKPEFKLSRLNIHNYSALIPDFLVRTHQDNYILIEIERPNKKPKKKSGGIRAEMTQAIQQLNQWELAIEDDHKLRGDLQEKYPSIHLKNKRSYKLIYGRNHHFKDDKEKDTFVNSILSLNSNTKIYTFDDFLNEAESVIKNILNPEIGESKTY